MSSPPLSPNLNFSESPEKFVLEDETAALHIDRVTHELTLHTPSSSFSEAALVRRPVAGLLGIALLPSGPALVLAAKRQKVGDLTSRNYAVFKLEKAEVLPFRLPGSEDALSPPVRKEDAAFRAMLGQTLDTKGFYFSYECDLTQSAQRRQDQGLEYSSVTSLFTRWDDRFVWNRFLLGRFLVLGPDFLRFCLPLVHGAVFIRTCSVNGKGFRWALVSRRSARRAGTRFTVRGCDRQGNVANFVETEQILESASAGVESSFVQTRGSIPLFWSQAPTVIEYKPDPAVATAENHVEAFVRHFAEQVNLYGEQTMVNLVDQKGAEGELEKRVCSVHTNAALRGVHYVAFDFHKECRHSNFDAVNRLINDLRPTILRHSYYLSHTSQSVGGVAKKQAGVIRTNCIDCLDRTNVVQSLIALEHLQDVLSHLGILSEGQLLSGDASFQQIFRNVWADHADAISAQYAGTGALKTDFTRTGKRTLEGMMADLQNSLVRYVKNNFADGFRQDAIDLFLGEYRMDQNPSGSSYYGQLTSSPRLPSDPSHWTQLLPIGLLAVGAVFVLTLLNAFDFENGFVAFVLLWAAVVAAFVGAVYRLKEWLVDRPKLIQRPRY